MKTKTTFVAGLFTIGTVITALAHGGATGIVKERMDAMSVMGKTVKTLSSMMRGEIPFNETAVIEGALAIKAHAGEKLTGLFPKDNHNTGSEARDEIWSNWDEFKAISNQLSVMADGLEAAADNGLMHSTKSKSSTMMGTGASMMTKGDGMMGNASSMPDLALLATMPTDGVFNMLTKTCSSCHTKFRLEKK
ncbi:MAG: cytochrome C [Hyphomicrobiales bacterium]|nr:MAG: cytochrome C [Hyphomicrobiales bacterium]